MSGGFGGSDTPTARPIARFHRRMLAFLLVGRHRCRRASCFTVSMLPNRPECLHPRALSRPGSFGTIRYRPFIHRGCRGVRRGIPRHILSTLTPTRADPRPQVPSGFQIFASSESHTTHQTHPLRSKWKAVSWPHNSQAILRRRHHWASHSMIIEGTVPDSRRTVSDSRRTVPDSRRTVPDSRRTV